MKVSVEVNPQKIREVIIYCDKRDDEIEQLKSMVENFTMKLHVSGPQGEHLVALSEILYLESVDGFVYAYTKEQVAKVSYSLDQIESKYGMQGFFRCSKSMILNLDHIEQFVSSIGNRITATLSNGECVIVSRHYAKLLRDHLKEGEK